MPQFPRGWSVSAAVSPFVAAGAGVIRRRAQSSSPHFRSPGGESALPSSRNLCARALTRVAAVVFLLAGVVGTGTAFAQVPAMGQEPVPTEGAEQAPAPDRIVVALLPILIHSMDSQDFLRAGLSDMLQSRLAREPQLAVLPIRDASAATNDLETARAQATAAGAAYVVYGTFTHFGDGASVDLTCAPVQGDPFGPREVFVHAGTLGGIIPTLDGLMDRVARYILEGPSEVATVAAIPGGPASDSASAEGGSAASSAELEALKARIETLERTLGIESEGDEVAVDDDIEVPGIFQVYDEDTAPN